MIRWERWIIVLGGPFCLDDWSLSHHHVVETV